MSAQETPEQGTQQQAPAIRVVRGNPSPEEVAAIVAVLSAASGGDDGARKPRTSPWTARRRFARPPMFAGPGFWRLSGLPR